MKTEQKIQERINTLNKEIEIHRKDLHNGNFITGKIHLLETIDRLRIKRDALQWVLDLDNKE